MKKSAIAAFIFPVLILIGCSTTSGTSGPGTSSAGVELAPAPAGPKKNIAVLNIVDKSGNTWYGHSLGDGITDMMITQFFKSNAFNVIEREKLGEVLEEQKLKLSGLMDDSTDIAEIGKLLNVSAIVTGAITDFSVREEGGSVGGGVVGSLTKGLVSGVSVKTSIASVSVDIRMIDTTTGQIIFADTAVGEESTTNLNVDSWRLPDFEIGSSKFDESIIGKATYKALNKVVNAAIVNHSKIPWIGYILKVENGAVWINMGSDQGIAEGQIFGVRSQGEEITDASGKVFVIPAEEIAEVKVVQVLPAISKVEIVSGGGIEKDMEIVYKE